MNEQDARAAVHAAIGAVAPDVELDDVDEDSRLRQDLELDSLDFLRLVETIDTATGVRHSGARLPGGGYRQGPDRLPHGARLSRM